MSHIHVRRFHTHLPASYITTQYDAKALEKSREQLVYGHVGNRRRAIQGVVGDVLPMDQNIVVGHLHGDGGMRFEEVR